MTPSLSLRRQLLLWLLLPQLVLWLGGGALTYRIALNYAEKGLDQSLSQSVKSLARQIKPMGSGLLVDFPKAAQAIIEEDPNDRVSYMVSSPPGKFLIGNQAFADVPLDINPESPVFYRIEIGQKPMRAVALDVAYGDADQPQLLRVQLAKSYVAHERIAKELIADLLAPLLVLGLLLSLLVYAGIKRGMTPLTRLERQLQERSSADLTPLALTSAPTEVHALVMALNRLLQAIQRSVKQEKRFINDAAHQLRTPLAGLINQTDLAMNETEPALIKARLHKVHAGALRSAHLVNQLLALARSGGSEVQLSPVDLANLAQDTARELSPKAVSLNVDLGYEGEAHAWVMGSDLLLREAISNLIDNALRYGIPEDTHTTPTITVRVVIHDAHVVLTIEDNGTGLSDTQREQAFERFWRGSELPGGCGLGLSIVQQIAKQHHGEAQVHPVLPHGLCVQLTLPCLPHTA